MARGKYSRKKFLKTLPVVSNGMLKVSRDGAVFLKKPNSKWVELNPHCDERGFKVKYFHEGKNITRFIHQLVAEAYLPNPDNKPEVVFIDGDNTNPVVENLAWATASELKAQQAKLKEDRRAAAEQAAAKEQVAADNGEPWAGLPEIGDGLLRIAKDGTVYLKEGDGFVELERQTRGSDGYLFVRYTEGGRPVTQGVHLLVAKAYIPNPNPKKYNLVGFQNNDISDISIENLKWLASSEVNTKLYAMCPVCGVHSASREDSLCSYCFKEVQASRMAATEKKPQFVWSDLPLLEDGQLRVSQDGKVYGREGDGFILKNQYKTAEYKVVEFLGTDGKRKRIGVHRLVAMAYVPNPDPERFRFVGFRNGNKDDIFADNLFWKDKDGISADSERKKTILEKSKPVAAKQANHEGAEPEWASLPEVANGLFRISREGKVYVRQGDAFVPMKTYKAGVRTRLRKTVVVIIDGERKSFAVHRLMAEAYLPNPDPDKYNLVLFKDAEAGICPENLYWTNQSEINLKRTAKQPAQCPECKENPVEPEKEMCEACTAAAQARKREDEAAAKAALNKRKKSAKDEAARLRRAAGAEAALKANEEKAARQRQEAEVAAKREKQEAEAKAKAAAEKVVPISVAKPTQQQISKEESEIEYAANALTSGLILPAGREDNYFARDYSVIQMRAEGMTVKAIAEEFSLSEASVTQIIASRTVAYKVFLSFGQKTA